MNKSELIFRLNRLSFAYIGLHWIGIEPGKYKIYRYEFGNDWIIHIDTESTDPNLVITSTKLGNGLLIPIEDIDQVDIINIERLGMLRISVQQGSISGYKILRLYNDGSYEFLKWVL